MEKPVFKRKIYDEILEWKENRSDKYALLIKGARRVGKSTIAEEFAKKEFKSYIMVDFAHTSKAIMDLFDDTYKTRNDWAHINSIDYIPAEESVVISMRNVHTIAKINLLSASEQRS